MSAARRNVTQCISQRCMRFCTALLDERVKIKKRKIARQLINKRARARYGQGKAARLRAAANED